MTIHPVRLNGLVIARAQTFDFLSRVQDRVTDFVTAHSGIARERYLALLSETGMLSNDIGSILSGEEAVALGLIDRVGGLADALACLHRRIGGEE